MFSQYLLSKKRGDTAQKDESMFNKNRSVVYPDEVMPAAEEASPVMSGLSAAGALGGGSASPNAAFSADSPAPGVTPNQGEASGWLNQNKGQFIAAMGAIAQHFGQTPGQVSAGRMLMQHGQAEMEQQRKDEAAQALGFATSASLDAESAKAKIDLTKAETKKSGAETEHLGESTLNLKEKTRQLTKETDEKFPMELKLLEAQIKENTARGDVLANQALLSKPKWHDFGDGVPVLVEQGQLLQMKNHFLTNQIKALELKEAGEDAAAEALMAGEKVDIMGLKIPFRLVKKYLPAYAAELGLRGELARAKSVSDQLAIEGQRAELKMTAEAKKAMVDNGFTMIQEIMKGSKSEIINGKEIMRTETPEAKIAKQAFASNAGQMIKNGVRWKDDRVVDLGDQWLNMAYQQKWITTADGIAMSGGVWRPPQGQPTAKPTPQAAPQSSAPTPERKVFVGSGLATPKDVPLGATERVIGGAASLPGTFASEGLKAYREQRDLTRGR